MMVRASKVAIALSVLMTVPACNVRQEGTDGANDVGNQATAGTNQIERGRYLAAIMDCAGCHNRGSFSPKPEEGYLEGGTVGFEVPGLGVFYPPNLTPHPDGGIGRWTDEDIIAAVRAGRRPDGRTLAPAMPWPAYSKLSDDDARALAAYLKSLPPSPNKVPDPATKETAPRPYMTVAAPTGSAK